jgi:hypothetical protein
MGNPYKAPSANLSTGAGLDLRWIVLQLFLGACYTLMQIALIRGYVHYFGVAETGLAKVFSVGISTTVSLLFLFLANRFLFKTRIVRLGFIAGLACFTYIYLVRPTGDRVFLLLDVLTYWPTFINMLLLVASPVLVAIGFRLMPNNSFKPKPLRGSA